MDTNLLLPQLFFTSFSFFIRTRFALDSERVNAVSKGLAHQQFNGNDCIITLVICNGGSTMEIISVPKNEGYSRRKNVNNDLGWPSSSR